MDFLWIAFVGFRIGPKDPRSLCLPKLLPSFPLDEYIENEGFTLLHEIACRLNDCDLDSALQTQQADVNKLSISGESPLELAVKRRNIDAVRILLKGGADPNINDGNPMVLALRSTSSVIVDLLLRSGAIVHGPTGDKLAETWIGDEWIDDDAENLTIDRLLIENGLDVNRQVSVSGVTQVMALCQRPFWCDENQDDRTKQLIGLGADLELRDAEGYTALHWAVCTNSPMTIETLLQSGARIDVKTNEGNTIAHLAVICCKDDESAEAMFKVDLGRLDLNLKNEDGHTAYDLLRKRNGLGWETYRNANGPGDERWTCPYNSRAWSDEYEIILALEALLHHIQDLQGIPKDQQYPPLGEYLSDDKDEDPVPGAWPV